MKARFLAILPLALILSMPRVTCCVEDFDDDFLLLDEEVIVPTSTTAVATGPTKADMSVEMPAVKKDVIVEEKVVVVKTEPVKPESVVTVPAKEESKEEVVAELTTRESLVKALKNGEHKHFAIKVYTDWCGACTMATPAFAEAAKEHKAAIKAYAVNADKADMREFVDVFGITGLPTVIYLRIDDKKSPAFEAALKDFKKLPAAVAHKKISGSKPAYAFKADMQNWHGKEAVAVVVPVVKKPEIKPVVPAVIAPVAKPVVAPVEVKKPEAKRVAKPAYRKAAKKRVARKHREEVAYDECASCCS